METEDFRPGDTVILPFLIVAAGAILNLSDVALRGELRIVDRETIPLAIGDGITIERPAPLPAAGQDPQDPHGIVTISAERSALLPMGNLTVLTLFVVNSAGVHMHARSVQLRGVA